MLKIILLMSLMLAAISVHADAFVANTGDQQLDQSLNELNKQAAKKKYRFMKNLADEYQLPVSKIEMMIKVHEFTPADCFLTVAVADASGQSVEVISRARIEHRDKGWQFITDQLRIGLTSDAFKQIKQDASINFLR